MVRAATFTPQPVPTPALLPSRIRSPEPSHCKCCLPPPDREHSSSPVPKAHCEGFFSETQAYTSANMPAIFLPSFAINTFQAYLSGDPGVTYTVQSSTNLTTWTTLTNLTIPNLSTNWSDTKPSTARFYRATVNTINYPPSSVIGKSFCSTILGGSAPYSTNGIFQFEAATNGNGYLLLASTGATNGSGTYAYDALVSTPPRSIIPDSTSGTTCHEQLLFTSVATGYFYTTNATSAGYQTGSFKTEEGPALFFGNARFTPDYARSTIGNFLADGTPLSISVTDARRECLVVEPARRHALLGSQPRVPRLPSPPASIRASPRCRSLAACSSGRTDTRFDDRSDSCPHHPGSRWGREREPSSPARAMELGTARGPDHHQPSQQLFRRPCSISVCGSASDPPNTAVQNLLPQATAAYNEAVRQLQNVENQKAFPPEPPDFEFMCGGNPGAQAQVDDYCANLFSEESAVIGNLLSAAHTMVLLTDDNSYGADAVILSEQLISTECANKLNNLYNSWSGNALKWAAYVSHPQHGSRGCALAGRQVTARMQVAHGAALVCRGMSSPATGTNLRQQHDYTMANVLLAVERKILFAGRRQWQRRHGRERLPPAGRRRLLVSGDHQLYRGRSLRDLVG